MIIIIVKFQVQHQVVILIQIIILEIDQIIQLVLVEAIIILHKGILFMLKITLWLINLQLDLIQHIIQTINKLSGEIIPVMIILMDTKVKIQHILVIILIPIMLLILMNTNLIVIINHNNIKEEIKPQVVIITLLLGKQILFKLQMMILQHPLLMLHTINIIHLIIIMEENLNFKDRHQLKI